MEGLLLYFGKMILCSAVMFGYYHLALKNRTFHHYNRFYLLSVVVVSVLLPLLKVSYFTIEVNSDIYRLFTKFSSVNQTKTDNHDFIYYRLIIFLFGLASVLILGRFFIGILKIRTFRRRFPKEEIEGISFYQTNLESAPFSFFRDLFWKNSILLNSDLGRQILKHEMVHIEQKHTYDKVFMELATGIFWINPIFWLIKKEINLIHEYLADNKAVKHMDTKAFAQMLLASHFSGTVIPATSPFLSSNLKKRLKMLQKPKTRFGYAHRILALPIVFTLVFVYAVNAKNKEILKDNKKIEQIVSQIKKDTVKVLDIDERIRVQSDSVRMYSEQLRTEDEKIRELSKTIAEKSKTVKALSGKNKLDSPEYLKAENELAELMQQQENIWNSPAYQEKWKNFEKHSQKMEDLFNSPEYKKKWEEMNKHTLDTEKNIAQMRLHMNSPSFQNQIREAERQAREAEKIAREAEKMINSPEFKRQIKDAERQAQDAVKAANEAEKVMNSKEFQQQIKDAARTEAGKATYRKEAAEASKEAALAAKRVWDLKNSDVSEDVKREAYRKLEEARAKAAEAGKKAGYGSYRLGENQVVIQNTIDGKKPKLFVDGVEQDWDKFKNQSPSNIESVTVYKNKGENSRGEIHVFTKKK